MERFATHVLEAHSWFKHLPLVEGGRFTIYLEPDLDRNYPTQHPKLPFGNHPAGYEKAFGHLAYQYCIQGVCEQDHGDKPMGDQLVKSGLTEIPEPHKSTWSFTLYPYCHYEFSEVLSLFENDLQTLKQGGQHPQRGLLLDWVAQLEKRNDRWYNGLTEAERELLIDLEDEEGPTKLESVSPPARDFFHLQEAVWDIENRLRSTEEEKVFVALNRLLLDHEQLKMKHGHNSP